MAVSISRDGDLALVTIDYPPVNALSKSLRQDLLDAVIALEADRRIRGVVLSCAGRTFIAGADVSEFDHAPEEPHLPDVIARIEEAAKPWCAAIHGTALGGGFEVTMGCRFRVMAASAQVGLPEVTLGVMPGSGGTVRTPRLAGIETAVDMVTSGKLLRARDAQGKGLVDLVTEAELVPAAMAFLREALTKPLPPAISKRPLATMPESWWQEQEAAIKKRVRGEAAPLRALQSLRNASLSDFASAMTFERTAFLELRASDQAAALRHVFFAERAAPRPPEMEGVAPRAIKRAAVIGGGTMGAGIAAALGDAGLPVMLVERDDLSLQRGLTNLRRIYEGSLKRGRLTQEQFDLRMEGVTGATDYTILADADIVIEAVFEDLDVKRAVFAQLGKTCRPDAILATNTSYLDPRAIAQDVPHPERFLGLHFFSPAQVMKLLEIVPTDATAADVLAAGFALARDLRKIPVRAGICDGFIGNRILKVTRAQAERLLINGATPSEIDAAMRGFGLPMGPFEAQDLGGLDIAAFQRKAARERGETPFAPVAERLCAMGRFGQKTGGGWYDYAEGNRAPIPSPVTEAQITAAMTEAGMTAGGWTAHDIRDVILLPMVNEGAKILQEGIALRAADIDLVKIHGYGFPRWLGGPMHWAQRRGLAEVLAKLDTLANANLAEAPCTRLRVAAQAGCF
jgi:3-hydroxyacyl-CoA dehydrogenase